MKSWVWVRFVEDSYQGHVLLCVEICNQFDWWGVLVGLELREAQGTSCYDYMIHGRGRDWSWKGHSAESDFHCQDLWAGAASSALAMASWEICDGKSFLVFTQGGMGASDSNSLYCLSRPSHLILSFKSIYARTSYLLSMVGECFWVLRNLFPTNAIRNITIIS